MIEGWARCEVEQILFDKGVGRTRDQLLVIAKAIPLNKKNSRLFVEWYNPYSGEHFGECVSFIESTEKLYVASWDGGIEGVFIVDRESYINVFVCYHYRKDE